MILNRRRSVVIAALAILVLLGCTLAAAGYWGTGPSLRCVWPQRGPAQVGWSTRTVASGGDERCYLLYVPASYDPARPTPLVVSLHGFLSNPASQALISGWHKLADQEGFLVAYPQGTSWPQRWNGGATWNVGVDDVQFFRDLLDDLASVAAVDRSRVYVNGFSNGGGMTVRIACDAADQVAAIGTVAAAVVEFQDCSPTNPVPVMAFHGTADPLVPYEGGEMPSRPVREGAVRTRAPTHFVGVEEWTASWAEGNGCTLEPETIPPQGDVRGVQYTPCNQGAEVILYTIEGGGHTWPGGVPIPIVGKTTEAIDATEEMWRFFQGYERDVQP
jgi:polyhydroxybutyrate depolymerase